MCLFYSMLPAKNTFMYLAIMCQPSYNIIS